MKKFLFVFALATIGITTQSTAQKIVDRTIQKNSTHKNHKINKGVYNGTINRREERVLKTQNRKLKQTMRCATADHKVTRREAITINNMNNKLNRNIRIAKFR